MISSQAPKQPQETIKFEIFLIWSNGKTEDPRYVEEEVIVEVEKPKPKEKTKHIYNTAIYYVLMK